MGNDSWKATVQVRTAHRGFSREPHTPLGGHHAPAVRCRECRDRRCSTPSQWSVLSLDRAEHPMSGEPQSGTPRRRISSRGLSPAGDSASRHDPPQMNPAQPCSPLVRTGAGAGSLRRGRVAHAHGVRLRRHCAPGSTVCLKPSTTPPSSVRCVQQMIGEAVARGPAADLQKLAGVSVELPILVADRHPRRYRH